MVDKRIENDIKHGDRLFLECSLLCRCFIHLEDNKEFALLRDIIKCKPSVPVY